MAELPELDCGTAYGLLYWVEVTGSPTTLCRFLMGELEECVTGVEVVTYLGGQTN